MDKKVDNIAVSTKQLPIEFKNEFMNINKIDIDKLPHPFFIINTSFDIIKMNHLMNISYPFIKLHENFGTYLELPSKSIFEESCENKFETPQILILKIKMAEKYYSIKLFVEYIEYNQTYRCIVHDQSHLKVLEDIFTSKNKNENTMDMTYKEIIFNLSHEIRTPLNSMMGSLFLMKDTELNVNQQMLLNQAMEASEVMLSAINDLLDIKTLHSGRVKVAKIAFSIKEMVAQIIALYEKQISDHQIKFISTIDHRVCDMYLGDYKHLKQVLMNLIGNAVRFTINGVINFKVMVVSEIPESQRVNFIVEDTGIGISEEHLNQLKNDAELGFNNHRDIRNAKLGIPVSIQLVKALGGVLILDSSVGIGSKFEFVITMDKVLETEIKSSEANDVFAKALIVEDDPINQKIMTIRLKKMGIDCEIATNGEKALMMCQKNDYQIIFMDCQMPIMDGYEATEKIRLLPMYGHTPIFALTAHAFYGEEEKVLRAGMNEYFTKPIDFVQLTAKILAYLG